MISIKSLMYVLYRGVHNTVNVLENYETLQRTS